MRTICPAVLACLILGLPSASRGAGLAFSDNFIVLSPDKALSDEILSEAERLRREIATDWLGAEFAAGKGRTGITVKLSETDDHGLTWPVDHPDRKLHRIWLTTSRDGALGPVLAHEMTHVVFATRFRGRLPAWADEGVAGLADDAERHRIRADAIESFRRSGRWPDLAESLRARSIPASDQEAYAVAVSLVRFLLTRGDKPTLLRFAVEANEGDLDRALQRHYGFRSLRQLQSAWQAWLSPAAHSSTSTGDS